MLGWGVAISVGLATMLVTGPLLRRLSEPDAPDGKTAYADLPTPVFTGVCALLAGAGAGLAWLFLPWAVQPLWWVLSSLGVLLAAVDARTTWLPLQLTRLTWLATAAATIGCMPLGADLGLVLRATAGAAAAAALYGLVWLVSRGGIGFGDVRFAPLVGAATAADSLALALAGIFIGSVLGAVHGLVRLALRRPGGFPYAPTILAGAYVACVWV